MTIRFRFLIVIATRPANVRVELSTTIAATSAALFEQRLADHGKVVAPK